MSKYPTIHLAPPRLGPEHIKEKIVCIRSHRERIFRVDAQRQGGQLIVHNYGHGGAGWTFLFGAIEEAIRLFISQGYHRAASPLCVVGAGCYGLLTALELAHRGYQVRIVARDLDDLPSDKAAGFFFPRPRKCSTQQECAQFYATGMASYRAYQQIARGEHPYINQGPKLLPAYFDPGIDPGFAPYSQQGLIDPPAPVTIDFGRGKEYHALRYTLLFINPAVMMQELRRAVQELGIPIVRAEISAWHDLEDEVVFNCAGAGAQALTSDPRIVPVQGHLITLQDQPIADLQYLINMQIVQADPRGRPRTELIYFAPKDQGILGITFIRGQADGTANQHEFGRLLERSRLFFGT